jgi:pilus assembly protein Flp/PilA
MHCFPRDSTLLALTHRLEYRLKDESQMNRFLQLLRDEEGPTSVEYAVMLALILMACIASITVFGQATGVSFDSSSTAIINATGGS